MLQYGEAVFCLHVGRFIHRHPSDPRQPATGCYDVQMLGLVLPWFGPMGGLFVISPIIEMDILESRWITKDTQCFTDAVNVCNTTSQYEYYFWNITNPDEVR